MANLHEKAVTCMSPLQEKEQEGEEDIDDYGNTIPSSNGCNCFGFFCFKGRSNEHKHLLQQEERGYRETWWNEKVKRVKEAAELCGGPKWKTLFRRLGRYFHFKRNNKHHRFQYDPQSYALNFDGGFDRNDDDDDDDDAHGFAS